MPQNVLYFAAKCMAFCRKMQPYFAANYFDLLRLKKR